MRALECDVSPHLIPDVHPYWGGLFNAISSPTPQDVYASHSWFHTYIPPPPPGSGKLDNPMLYHNPWPGYPTHASAWGALFPYSYVQVGLASPPGSFLPVPFSNSFLFPGQLTTQFGPFAPCTGSSATTFTVGPYCFGDTAALCPDQILSLGGVLLGYGIRYNCELNLGGQLPNLQTFLGVDPTVPPAGPQMAKLPRVLEDHASPEQVQEAVRRLLERKK
jgi:hypothetical protein